MFLLSFPTRERGLKQKEQAATPDSKEVVPHAGTWIEMAMTFQGMAKQNVVPHAGTWIEIRELSSIADKHLVVPHAGTWIEMQIADASGTFTESFPTRERGLK